MIGLLGALQIAFPDGSIHFGDLLSATCIHKLGHLKADITVCVDGTTFIQQLIRLR